jgi:hypothetical protein
MRSPRSVTIAPIGMPSRTLKAAIDFFARVTTGFCPVICPSSFTAGSISFAFCVASPTPMFTTILFRRGTAIGFLSSSSFIRTHGYFLLKPRAQPRPLFRRVPWSLRTRLRLDRCVSLGLALGRLRFLLLLLAFFLLVCHFLAAFSITVSECRLLAISSWLLARRVPVREAQIFATAVRTSPKAKS